MSQSRFRLLIKAVTTSLALPAGPATVNEAGFVLRPVDTSSPRATLRRLAAPIFLVLASLFISYFSTRHFRLTGNTYGLLIVSLRILLILSTACILNLGIRLIGEIVIKSMHRRSVLSEHNQCCGVPARQVYKFL